jgi:hypothetical protein
MLPSIQTPLWTALGPGCQPGPDRVDSLTLRLHVGDEAKAMLTGAHLLAFAQWPPMIRISHLPTGYHSEKQDPEEDSHSP